MSGQGSFFQRFQAPDPPALARQIEQTSEELVQARSHQNEQWQLELSSKIGANSTILGKEAEAVPLLEEALILARRLQRYA